MAQTHITEVMMDDKPIDASKEIAMVFSIANTLRGPYKADRYKDVIIPMIILRRIECALEKTKEQVVAAYKKNKKAPVRYLCNISGYPFYNTSEFTLKKLLDEAPSIVENMNFYIDSFSPNIKSIFAELEFKSEIKNLDKNNRLLGVVKKFSELDLNPETVDGIKMGYMFEEIIRRFSENAEAGDHYTPREVIRLLTSILLAEGCDDIYRPGREITVLDMACGTGGMLSTSHDFIKRMNPDANVRLFGQENNPESHAICLADMLIKNQDAENIRFADTMKKDCFEGTSMRFVIANPPFGIAWGGKDAGDGVEKAVRAEHKKGQYGRFPAGLPATGDMQLLFMQHAISKMQKGKGRGAIISNGSPLFSGNTTSGESQIRRWMLEKDYIEAIIGLSPQLFYNTDIAIYAFILSKNKSKERKNKIQLIDATDVWEPMRRSLGKKRREISRQQIRLITEVYTAFAEGEKHQYSEKRKADCIIKSKIFDRNEFLYKEWAAYQPLQRSGIISDHTIEKLKTSAFFTSNAHVYNESTFMELEQTNPRSNKDEKAYQKMLRGKKFTEDVLRILEENKSEETYQDYKKFETFLKEILRDVDGVTPSRISSIATELSEIDKTAVIQKDRKGNPLVDPTTKDTEIIKLNQNVEEYMKEEVLPHVPDAIWRYEYDPNKAESSSNRERLGAEFPFTRYFYEYEQPRQSEDVLQEFFLLENELSKKIEDLRRIMKS
jgi:type I restriction enzyme M protein